MGLNSLGMVSNFPPIFYLKILSVTISCVKVHAALLDYCTTANGESFIELLRALRDVGVLIHLNMVQIFKESINLANILETSKTEWICVFYGN